VVIWLAPKPLIQTTPTSLCFAHGFFYTNIFLLLLVNTSFFFNFGTFCGSIAKIHIGQDTIPNNWSEHPSSSKNPNPFPSCNTNCKPRWSPGSFCCWLAKISQGVGHDLSCFLGVSNSNYVLSQKKLYHRISSKIHKIFISIYIITYLCLQAKLLKYLETY
jgi:hypothetical protein